MPFFFTLPPHSKQPFLQTDVQQVYNEFWLNVGYKEYWATRRATHLSLTPAAGGWEEEKWWNATVFMEFIWILTLSSLLSLLPYLQSKEKKKDKSQRMCFVNKQTNKQISKLLSPAYKERVIKAQHLLSTISKSEKLWKTKVLFMFHLATKPDLSGSETMYSFYSF